METTDWTMTVHNKPDYLPILISSTMSVIPYMGGTG